MGRLNITTDMYLGRNELVKLVDFLDSYGWRLIMKNSIGKSGIIKSSLDVNFDNFKVTPSPTPGGIKIGSESLAVDSLGYIESKTNIPDINLSYQTSVNNISNKSNVYIYPQPVKNLLNVYNFVQSENYTDMQIFDMCGKCIINKQIQSNHNSNALNIDVSEIESGIYLLVLKNDKGSSRLLFTK